MQIGWWVLSVYPEAPDLCILWLPAEGSSCLLLPLLWGENQHRCQAGKGQLMAVVPSSNSHPKTSSSLAA